MESETQLTLSKLQIHSERKYPLLSANYCTPVDINEKRLGNKIT